MTEGTRGGTASPPKEQPLLGVLADVLERRAIRHVFQPLWHIPSGQLLGFEALARFERDVPPDRLWEVASATPWWPTLDLISLESALLAARTLPGRLFLNVSARFLELTPADRDRALDLLARYRPHLDQVVLEITETAITDPVRASAGARYWQSRGIALALDDAGAGATGPERVALLRPDFVKMDRLIVQQWIDGDPQALIRWSSWSETVGASLVIEGLERAENLGAFRLLGPVVVQGHAFGPPLPAGEWTPDKVNQVAPPPPAPATPVTGQGVRAPEWLRGNTELVWREHRRDQAERVLSAARELVVPVVVVGWMLVGRGSPAGPPWATWLVAVAGLAWSAASAAFLFGGWRPRPWWRSVSLGVDGAWTLAWVAVTGGPSSPFLPLVFWQLLLALIRLPLWPAVGAAVAYGTAYAVFAGAVRPTLVYAVVVAVTTTIWWRLFEEAPPRQLRDDLTGFFGREYGLFLLERALVEYGEVGVVAFELTARPRMSGSGWIRAASVLAAQAFVEECALVRYGPTTFLAVCPQFDAAASLDRARDVRERIGRGVWTTADGSVLRFEVRLGVAVGHSGITAEELVRRGLHALRRASGRPDHVALWAESAVAKPVPVEGSGE